MNASDTSVELETVELTWDHPPLDEDEIPTVILEWHPRVSSPK